MLGRQTGTSGPLVLEPSSFGAEIAVRKVKMYNSPAVDEINRIVGKMCPEIHRIINSVLNKENLPQQWKESIIVPTCKRCDKTDW
jgi:lysyl-tRNA synthetase class I